MRQPQDDCEEHARELFMSGWVGNGPWAREIPSRRDCRFEIEKEDDITFRAKMKFRDKGQDQFATQRFVSLQEAENALWRTFKECVRQEDPTPDIGRVLLRILTDVADSGGAPMFFG
jgi:hypothetical protein